jgi:hypothetical protein
MQPVPGEMSAHLLSAGEFVGGSGIAQGCPAPTHSSSGIRSSSQQISDDGVLIVETGGI